MMKSLSPVIQMFFVAFLTASVTSQVSNFKDKIYLVSIIRGYRVGDNFTLASYGTRLCDNLSEARVELRADCSRLESAYPADNRESVCFLKCTCMKYASSFLVDQKRCSDASELRMGCTFVFGSYTWLDGWNWNSENDPLQVVDLAKSYGFMSGFNASIKTFETCFLNSVSTYSHTGVWKLFNPTDELPVTFFKLHSMWHVGLVTEVLPKKKLDEIQAKFIKFSITCENQFTKNGVVVQYYQKSSCAVIKAMGNFTYQYNVTQPTSSITSIVPTFVPTTVKSDKDKTAQIIGVAVGCSFVIFIVGGLLFIAYTVRYKKKRFNQFSMHRIKVEPQPAKDF